MESFPNKSEQKKVAFSSNKESAQIGNQSNQVTYQRAGQTRKEVNQNNIEQKSGNEQKRINEQQSSRSSSGAEGHWNIFSYWNFANWDLYQSLTGLTNFAIFTSLPSLKNYTNLSNFTKSIHKFKSKYRFQLQSGVLFIIGAFAIFLQKQQKLFLGPNSGHGFSNNSANMNFVDASAGTNSRDGDGVFGVVGMISILGIVLSYLVLGLWVYGDFRLGLGEEVWWNRVARRWSWRQGMGSERRYKLNSIGGGGSFDNGSGWIGIGSYQLPITSLKNVSSNFLTSQSNGVAGFVDSATLSDSIEDTHDDAMALSSSPSSPTCENDSLHNTFYQLFSEAKHRLGTKLFYRYSDASDGHKCRIPSMVLLYFLMSEAKLKTLKQKTVHNVVHGVASKMVHGHSDKILELVGRAHKKLKSSESKEKEAKLNMDLDYLRSLAKSKTRFSAPFVTGSPISNLTPRNTSQIPKRLRPSKLLKIAAFKKELGKSRLGKKVSSLSNMFPKLKAQNYGNQKEVLQKKIHI